MEDFFKDRLKPNIFRKIYLWWQWQGKHIHTDIIAGIKKLWYWLPIIWKDRDWDSHYIYEILKHKLKAQAKYISDRDRHTRAQQDAGRMRICVKLIEKCQDNYYTLEHMDYAEDRHWFEPCKDGSGNSTWESENVWERYDDYIKKYPLIYKKVMKGEGLFTLDGKDENEIKSAIAMNIAHINQDRAKKLLFKIMQENIEKWWD